MSSLLEARAAAEKDLYTFIRLVSPNRVLGACHKELIYWWTRENAGDHQLVLMPRDHQKSAMIAYRVAWEITKNPCATFLYVSATSGLAEKQLYFIKNILSSKVYRKYWPEMLHPDEGKREKWTTEEIMVDHPQRKLEGIRDATVKTAGLTTGITGLHFSHAVLDDVVVKENAYTNEGRSKVASQYSLLSSIESTGTDEDSSGAKEWVVGTRYHPADLYNSLVEMEYEVYDPDTFEVVGSNPVYEMWQREVEDRGDGTGEFLWPRQQNRIGRWYGFNQEILAKKRAKYLDKTQFRAQYYNNPNDPDNERISRDRFQYYDKKHINHDGGAWFFRNKKLNVYAAIDFAYSLSKRADSTAIVVIGVDSENNTYVLDVDRFKTDGKPSEYFKHLLEAHQRWGFRKLRAEINSGQKSIVESLKEGYIKPQGIMMSIDEKMQNRHEGTKEERLASILEPRYENQMVWHYRGGNCQILEDELALAHPPHDDVKDALAAAIDVSSPPSSRGQRSAQRKGNVVYHSRFGGIRA